MNKARITYVDFGAGIMILWVIISHVIHAHWQMALDGWWGTTDLNLLLDNVHAFIDETGSLKLNPITDICPYLFFFMPWFFYKSGQFFKKRGVIELVKKDARKFLVQFLIWSTIGYVLYLCYSYISGSLSFHSVIYSTLRKLFLEGSVEINGPLWFLLTIFGVRQVANLILPDREDRLYKVKSISIVVAGISVAYVLYLANFRLTPQWVANGAAGLSFFTLGYSLQQYSGNYLLTEVMCLAGIITFNNVCRCITKYLDKISRPFKSIGKNAMIIYVSHGLLYTFVTYTLPALGLNNLMPYTLWLIVGTYVLFLPLFYYLNLQIKK